MDSVNPQDAAYLLAVTFRTVNKGKEKAERLDVRFNEPTPLLQLSGNTYSGVTNGELDTNEAYEGLYYFTFENREDLASFAARASVSVKWVKNNQSNEQKVMLPNLVGSIQR
ncbi:hypothetical protein COHCIP112018_04229 [Cohnella sp. JJ-181]|nr:hypothetical protein COHCIP112018_04229 [Cohnella sp. JJ-181]